MDVRDAVWPVLVDPTLRLASEWFAVGTWDYGAAICAWDFNGDGLNDIVISDPDAAGISDWAGGVGFIYYRREDGDWDPAESLYPQGLDRYDHFGDTMACGGDADADGFPDLAISAPLHPYPYGDGSVYLFMGGPSGLTGDPQELAEPPVVEDSGNDRFGRSMSWGDTDGDGYSDLLIGAPLRGESPLGEALL